MLLHSKDDIGIKAPDFKLPAVDGQDYSLGSLIGEKGLVVAFICNHCPYVHAIIERLVGDAKVLQDKGFGVVAISANDAEHYPQDSFENMKIFAQKEQFSFPYLYDEKQATAKAYDAVCTPDIYGIGADGMIHYRGRLDDIVGMNVTTDMRKTELVDAMRYIANHGTGPNVQHNSMGCSIKWK